MVLAKKLSTNFGDLKDSFRNLFLEKGCLKHLVLADANNCSVLRLNTYGIIC
jgi:hypothetical protein